MTKILLVDDDEELTDLLKEYLGTYGIACETAENGRLALERIKNTAYDLLVLDIMMPELDGLSVLKRLPVSQSLPVIMLSAKDDDIDRIIGLELGADDYIGKPCNPRELLARINAVIKRTQVTDKNSPTKLPESLLQMDKTQRHCHIEGKTIVLTSTEFDLLYLLLIKKGQTVDKESLSVEVLQRELQPFDRSIDVHISRLRKKLTPYHDEPIKSLRGKGYQLII